MNKKLFIKNITGGIIVLAVIIFFSNEFFKNYILITQFSIKINYIYLIVSFFFTLLSYLMLNYSWLEIMNTGSIYQKLNFIQSIAIYSSGELTKYLPGRVWSYLLQMFWLKKKGFSKSYVLYVGIIQIVSLVILSFLSGLFYLMIYSKLIAWQLIILFIGIGIIFEIIFIFFNSQLFNSLIILINKFFKKDIQKYKLCKTVLLKVQLQQIIFILLFGIGVYFVALGVGFSISCDKILSISAIAASANIIGWLLFITPGGLGVREGVMFVLFNELGGKLFGLIVPIAYRLISMLVDIILGGIGIILLKKFMNKENTKIIRDFE